MPLTGVLVIPAVAAALLAVLPGYRVTARLNVAATPLTLPLRAVAVLRPAGAGRLSPGRRPQHHLHRAHHLRRLHHQRVQRELHRPRAGDRPADAAVPALLPRHVSGADVRDEPGAGRQQYRPDVGGDRAGDADHGADGRHLPHPRGARGGVEIFHSRQRRHRARAVRHHPRLHGRAAGGRRRPRRHGVDRAGHPRRRLRSGAAQPRLRLPAARLRHQGRARAAARLAARRPRRGPDADLGGAVGAAAQRRALRAAALQDAAGGQRRRRSRPAR